MTSRLARKGGADLGAPAKSKAFTGWKLDLLFTMARDPKVRPVDFHIAFIVMQHVNQFTGQATLSDYRLQQLAHRDRKALMLARKRLVALGWLRVRTGRYGRATEYEFLDERAKKLENIWLDEQILAREEEDANGAETPHSKVPYNEVKTPHDKNRSEEKSPRRALGRRTPCSKLQWGESATDSGVKAHPLHLQTPKNTLPPKGTVSTHAYDAHVCAYDAWAENEETAARLEYDEGLPRREAEHRARILCGFDNEAADGWQGTGIAPPITAKRIS